MAQPLAHHVLASGRSEIAAMAIDIHEAKEREKIEAAMEQHQANQREIEAMFERIEAEASARETELKRNLDQLRAHAAEELTEAKAYLQAQLADANAALSESEEQLSSLREWAATLHEQVAQALDSCLHAASKVDQTVQDATANAQVQHQAAIASAQHQVAAALEAKRQAEGRSAALGLALAADRELLLRAQQEAEVAAEVHARTREALDCARRDLTAREDEVRVANDKTEALEDEVAGLVLAKGQMAAQAEEDALSAARVRGQLEEALRVAKEEVEEMKQHGGEVEEELERARERLDEVLRREASKVEELEAELAEVLTPPALASH